MIPNSANDTRLQTCNERISRPELVKPQELEWIIYLASDLPLLPIASGSWYGLVFAQVSVYVNSICHPTLRLPSTCSWPEDAVNRNPRLHRVDHSGSGRSAGTKNPSGDFHVICTVRTQATVDYLSAVPVSVYSSEVLIRLVIRAGFRCCCAITESGWNLSTDLDFTVSLIDVAKINHLERRDRTNPGRSLEREVGNDIIYNICQW